MGMISAIVSTVLILMSFVPNFGFAGGGGSDSGGSSSGSDSSFDSSSSSDGSSSSFSPLSAAITLLIILFFLVDTGTKTHKVLKRKLTPQEKLISEEAKKIFVAYQSDWSEMNLQNIATYTTPEYNEHACLMLEALKNLHRKNTVSNLKVRAAVPMNDINDTTSYPTQVDVRFWFSGLDEVVDTNSGKKLYKNKAVGIYETWSFIFDGTNLKLSGISQPTESPQHLVRSLADFAKNNQLFYSPDWGRYALPSRGLIFGGSSMRTADVNNHIVGKWQDLLIQLYTYAMNPSNPSSYYLVGQINVPKEYLGVIVESKKYKNHLKIDKTYDKFEMEWTDFNKRYEVYATSRDALPAFELLNPQFMEYLYSTNPNYNLEVVDNTIYIFVRVSHVTEKNYSELLEVLRLAHKELKM